MALTLGMAGAAADWRVAAGSEEAKAGFAAFHAGDAAEWRFESVDERATLEAVYPGGMEFRSVTVTTTGGSLYLAEAEVSGDGVHWRKLLGREINLPAWPGGGVRTVDLPPAAVGDRLRLEFRANQAGYPVGAGIAAIAVDAVENRPERHLLCWSGDWRRDYLDQLDFIDRELGITDLWLDYVETAFPQSNCNAGLASLEASGLLEELGRRGMRFWLGEHEAVTTLAQRPEDWHDDIAWRTVFREMRRIYGRARELGFRGVVFDAENYFPLPEEIRRHYVDELQVTDHASTWSFVEEFGYDGAYYRRGLEFGRIFREIWPEGIFMQLYEARMYAGIPGCRDGNYWWLRGLADGGVREIWIATEKSYGAGENEITGSLEHLHHWFVDPDEFIPEVFAAYPMAARVLPGFHPWNSRLAQPMYRPEYLSEQLAAARRLARGCWIYLEGTAEGGNPYRQSLEEWEANGVDPEAYLAILRKSTRNQGE